MSLCALIMCNRLCLPSFLFIGLIPVGFTVELQDSVEWEGLEVFSTVHGGRLIGYIDGHDMYALTTAI